MGTTAVKHVTRTVKEGVSKPMDGVQTARRVHGALRPVTIAVLPDVLVIPVIVAMDTVVRARRDFGALRPVTKIVLPDVLVIPVIVAMEAVMRVMKDSMELIAARDVILIAKMDAPKQTDIVVRALTDGTAICATCHAPQVVHAVTRPMGIVRLVQITATWCSQDVQIVMMAITGRTQLPASSARGRVTTIHRVTRPPVTVTSVHLEKRGNSVTEIFGC
ncbi:uncharacterized protein [Littorina saxatilis]|uniref:uncharacterized protein n=1 Tax=Littorina saxatilis TaxID=31220 RepID=UPI0038B6083F